MRRTILAATLVAGLASAVHALDLDLNVGVGKESAGKGSEVVEGSKEAVQNGWNVRVCAPATKAEEVKIEVGEPGAKERETLATWSRSDAKKDVQIYAVPDRLSDAKRIWVRGTTKPKNEDVMMAVFYGDQAKKVLRFHERKAANVGAQDAGGAFQCPTG